MIHIKSTMACNRRTLYITSVTHNLQEVPGWLQGNTLAVSKWNIELSYNGTATSVITDTSYPIVHHFDAGQDVSFQKVKIYRTIGTHELYFDISLSEAYGRYLDIYIEFVNKTENDS